MATPRRPRRSTPSQVTEKDAESSQSRPGWASPQPQRPLPGMSLAPSVGTPPGLSPVAQHVPAESIDRRVPILPELPVRPGSGALSRASSSARLADSAPRALMRTPSRPGLLSIQTSSPVDVSSPVRQVRDARVSPSHVVGMSVSWLHTSLYVKRTVPHGFTPDSESHFNVFVYFVLGCVERILFVKLKSVCVFSMPDWLPETFQTRSLEPSLWRVPYFCTHFLFKKNLMNL